MSLFSFNEQTGRAHGALAGSGRAVTRNGQNLSKADDAVAKQL
jgi:hypothetical protein